MYLFCFVSLTVQSPLRADIPNISLSCVPSNGAKVKCRLDETVTLSIGLAGTPWDKVSSTSEYVLVYRFPCLAHKHGLVFSCGDSQVAVRSSDGEEVLTAFVKGPAELKLIDQDPTTTYRASFVGDCKLSVVSVTVLPNVREMRAYLRLIRHELGFLRRVSGQVQIIQTSGHFLELRNLFSKAGQDDSETSETVLSQIRNRLSEVLTDDSHGNSVVTDFVATEVLQLGELEAEAAYQLDTTEQEFGESVKALSQVLEELSIRRKRELLDLKDALDAKVAELEASRVVILDEFRGIIQEIRALL
ncbi:MAG: hypothetical protein HYW48_10240 [Deltaproteobacteria bacterium]|nr:hypothetical protein [Deltaproteobacteria bacterium]